MLKLLDLFSGIGGFSLGMEATNRIKTIAFVEKDKFCQKVLNKNFKNIPIEEDIRNVKGSNYTADIVSGGFPCQPFSVAGKRKGKDDDRYLWDETIRVVAETKPKWFVGENVEGIINISNGTVLQQIQQDLEKEGFQVQCLVIPASGVGAWHQRKRVWIIGCNVSNSNYSGCKDRTKQHRWEQTQNEKRFDSFSRSNIISNSNSNRNTNEIERSNGEKEKVQREHRQEDSSAWKFIRTNSNDVPNTSSQRQFTRNNREMETKTKDKKGTRDQSSFQTLSSCSDVPNTNSRMRRRWGTIGQSGANEIWRFCSEKEKQTQHDIRSKTVGCDALLREENSSNTNEQRTQIQAKGKHTSIKMSGGSSKESWWETQSSLCGVPNGISYELDKDRTNRIKALGNSIVPLIAYEIGKAIISAEDQSD
jgi:DNA (cytosine-5)-methyltransferase 1